VRAAINASHLSGFVDLAGYRVSLQESRFFRCGILCHAALSMTQLLAQQTTERGRRAEPGLGSEHPSEAGPACGLS